MCLIAEKRFRVERLAVDVVTYPSRFFSWTVKNPFNEFWRLCAASLFFSILRFTRQKQKQLSTRTIMWRTTLPTMGRSCCHPRLSLSSTRDPSRPQPTSERMVRGAVSRNRKAQAMTCPKHGKRTEDQRIHYPCGDCGNLQVCVRGWRQIINVVEWWETAAVFTRKAKQRNQETKCRTTASYFLVSLFPRSLNSIMFFDDVKTASAIYS